MRIVVHIRETDDVLQRRLVYWRNGSLLFQVTAEDLELLCLFFSKAFISRVVSHFISTGVAEILFSDTTLSQQLMLFLLCCCLSPATSRSLWFLSVS